MTKKIVVYLLLLALSLMMASPLVAQVQSRFVLPGSIDFGAGITTIDDSTYQIRADLLADQTGNNFMASQIAVGWRVFTNTKRMYRITDSQSSGFTGRLLTLVEVSPTNGAPSGTQLEVYQYDGTNEAIPTAPRNSVGISASFGGILDNHNFVVLNQSGGGGGGDDVPILRYEYVESGTMTTISLPFTPDYTRPVQIFRNGAVCTSCTLDQANNEIDLSISSSPQETFTVIYQ